MINGYRLSDDTYEFIKGEVINTFIICGVKKLPVSGIEIASKLGIHLVPFSDLSNKRVDAAHVTSDDGLYLEDNERNPGEEFIFYNDDADILPERVNMTILHEIGHCALDHKGHSDEEEAEAKFFAKYAAAPPALISMLKEKNIWSIEEVFCISNQAALIAQDNYMKWCQYGRDGYTDYEDTLLNLFAEYIENSDEMIGKEEINGENKKSAAIAYSY